MDQLIRGNSRYMMPTIPHVSGFGLPHLHDGFECIDSKSSGFVESLDRVNPHS